MKNNNALKYLMLTGAVIVILIPVIFLIKGEEPPHPTVVEISGTGLEREAEKTDRLQDDLRPKVSEKEKTVQTSLPAENAITKAPEKTVETDGPDKAVKTAGFDEDQNIEPEIEITPEQEYHYQMTQIFKAEAKERLPVIGIRSFNARQARVRGEGTVAAETTVETEESVVGENGEILGTDTRGLKDGEVWIRINPADSGEHKEIMAQVADLYRSNMNFAGEVTVLLWVGGRPIERETYSLQ